MKRGEGVEQLPFRGCSGETLPCSAPLGEPRLSQCGQVGSCPPPQCRAGSRQAAATTQRQDLHCPGRGRVSQGGISWEADVQPLPP